LISAPIAIIIILYGAFQILTSAGNSEKMEAGKKTITWAVIGFALVVAAGGLAEIIRSIFS